MDIGTQTSLEKKQDQYSEGAAPSLSLNKRSGASSVKDTVVFRLAGVLF